VENLVDTDLSRSNLTYLVSGDNEQRCDD
jgi:hypothetical protein